MSEENVAALRPGAEAFNRRDIEAMLNEVDDEVEWHAVLPMMLGGEATVSRGHDGVREMFRDQFDVLDEIHVEYVGDPRPWRPSVRNGPPPCPW